MHDFPTAQDGQGQVGTGEDGNEIVSAVKTAGIIGLDDVSLEMVLGLAATAE